MTVELLTKKTSATESPSYTLDSFLDSFGVPRQNALYEMVLPGLIVGEDQLKEELDPGAALVHVIYRLSEKTEHLASFVELMRSNSDYMDGNTVTEMGLSAASRITVSVDVKVSIPSGGGYRRETQQRPLDEAARIQNGKRIVLIDRGGLYINPNASILPTAEIERRLKAKDIQGSSFFIPAPVAEDLLLPPTASDSKQSTVMRFVFPQGAYFLDSWFWAGDRKARLQRDKWSTLEQLNETTEASV